MSFAYKYNSSLRNQYFIHSCPSPIQQLKRILISSTLFNSGLFRIVTPDVAAAILRPGSPMKISAFTGCGQTIILASIRKIDSESSLDRSTISDLVSRMQKDWPTLACPSGDGMKFWGHEWEKHGTCTSLDQHSYFQAALDLKSKANLLQVLGDAGIRPGKFYSLESIKQAIEEGLGYGAYIECNVDPAGNHQLYQVYLCVDTSASNFIQCPVLPHGRGCGNSIEFPSFSSDSQSRDEL
ncbi:UNVERIFIED_CONTAM: Intracellular ribonuclease LX [Sesamum calycinum]|uniref:Intracellular ribonuclease LX n=1 Tax=Sesamum calycinum TaxID=2727403 RepID=A0AAW2PPD5_9LAMI